MSMDILCCDGQGEDEVVSQQSDNLASFLKSVVGMVP